MRVLYSQFIQPGQLCFDVGANIGNRTKIFRCLGATVVAIEPQRRCMDVLQAVYDGDEGVILMPCALGEKEGTAELIVSDVHTLSSISQEWLRAVKLSGRFAGTAWNERQTVEVTTLDELIHRFGVPAFVKIDVEGYELQVTRGLSQAIEVLSLEFTPEFLDSTLRCIDYLLGLGPISVNYSPGESMRFALSEWVSASEAEALLKELSRGSEFGDVYVKFL